MSKDKVTRRDLTLTSLAMGAAAVLPTKGWATEAASARAAATPAAAPVRKYPEGWTEGSTIPAEYYTDEKQYARDELYIRDNYWWMVDHESRIPKPGDYFLWQFGRGDSIIVARDDKGAINAFHNVCQHRGSRLCLHDEELPGEAGPGGKRPSARFSVRQLGQEGNTSVFRCPYHAWIYDLSGKLVSVPPNIVPADFKLEEHSAHPAHLRVVDGFIFLSPAVGPAPEFTMPTGDNLMHPKLKVAARRSHPNKANWKLVLENFIECYHCGPAHGNSVTTARWDGDQTLNRAQVAALSEESKKLGGPELTWENYIAHISLGYNYREKTAAATAAGMGGSSRGRGPRRYPRPGFVAETLDGKPAVTQLLPGITERNSGRRPPMGANVGGLMYFMNGLLTADDYAVIYRFTPRSYDTTDVELVWLVHPDAVEGKDYNVEHLIGFWNETVREDRWVAENNFVGLRSSRYRYNGASQPYMQPVESGPAGFASWYMGEMVPAALRAEKKA